MATKYSISVSQQIDAPMATVFGVINDLLPTLIVAFWHS